LLPRTTANGDNSCRGMLSSRRLVQVAAEILSDRYLAHSQYVGGTMKIHVVAMVAAAWAVSSGGTARATCSASDHEFSDNAVVVSDEGAWPCNGYSNLCNPGHLVTALTCTGSHCDNMRYQ